MIAGTMRFARGDFSMFMMASGPGECPCGRITGIVCGVAVLAALCLHPAMAATQECKLSQVASIQLANAPDGTPLVPVKINGNLVNLKLDLNDPFSFLASDASAQLKLAQTDSPYMQAPNFLLETVQTKDLVFKGKALVVTVPEMEIGALTARNIQLFSASGLTTNGEAGGIGLNILANYDIELDLAKSRLNFFDPNHCPGQVVYWTHEPVGVVDMQPMPGGTYHYAFNLDGKRIGAFLSADRKETLLAFPVAREDFNLTHTSKDVTPAGTDEQYGSLYRYPFKALDANGLAISSPEVYIFGDEYYDKVCDSEFHSRTWDNNGYTCRGDAALKIGLHELRALHLFFDFREKKLYATAAGAN
jgi:hypothetical protein